MIRRAAEILDSPRASIWLQEAPHANLRALAFHGYEPEVENRLLEVRVGAAATAARTAATASRTSRAGSASA